MFLVSDIHQQAKNIIQCMLEKRNYVNLNIQRREKSRPKTAI